MSRREAVPLGHSICQAQPAHREAMWAVTSPLLIFPGP